MQIPLTKRQLHNPDAQNPVGKGVTQSFPAGFKGISRQFSTNPTDTYIRDESAPAAVFLLLIWRLILHAQASQTPSILNKF